MGQQSPSSRPRTESVFRLNAAIVVYVLGGSCAPEAAVRLRALDVCDWPKRERPLSGAIGTKLPFNNEAGYPPFSAPLRSNRMARSSPAMDCHQGRNGRRLK
jgi:hypothetical protein